MAVFKNKKNIGFVISFSFKINNFAQNCIFLKIWKRY